MNSIMIRVFLCAFFYIFLLSCGSTVSVNDSEAQTDSISAIEEDTSSTSAEIAAEQCAETSIPETFPDNTLEMGAVAFWDEENDQRVYLSRTDYKKLSDNVRKRLKPLGLVIKLNTKFYILDCKKKSGDTDWYTAMNNASKCHPYDDGRWSLPSLSEARYMAKVQDDIVYWIPRWETDYPRVLFYFSGDCIETFVSDNSSSVFIDVTLSNGQIEVNRVQRCDEEKAKDYPYTQAYYISEIKHTPEDRTNRSNKNASTNNNSTPVQVWRQCTNCLGSGQCPYCNGQGHYYDVYGTHSCPVCTGGRCSSCAGQGGHYEIEYR